MLLPSLNDEELSAWERLPVELYAELRCYILRLLNDGPKTLARFPPQVLSARNSSHPMNLSIRGAISNIVSISNLCYRPCCSVGDYCLCWIWS